MIFPAIANGNISPARFLMVDVTLDNAVIQATAGARTCGISQKGTRRTPYAGLDDGLAAIAGENIHFFGPPETAPLELGGTVTRGDGLKADATGRGVTAGTAGDNIGALAEQSGVLGDIIEVQIIAGKV